MRIDAPTAIRIVIHRVIPIPTVAIAPMSTAAPTESLSVANARICRVGRFWAGAKWTSAMTTTPWSWAGLTVNTAALKLTVDGGDLELYDLVIQVGDDYIRPSLHHHFSPGTASPTIDLPGDKRTVGRVDFYYRSADRRDGRAIVSLYGR